MKVYVVLGCGCGVEELSSDSVILGLCCPSKSGQHGSNGMTIDVVLRFLLQAGSVPRFSDCALLISNCKQTSEQFEDV